MIQIEVGDTKALNALVIERAYELREFCISDLAEEVIRQGGLGNIRDCDPMLVKFAHRGLRESISGLLKRPETADRARVAYALETGPKARWKTWNAMTRRDAKAHYGVLIQQRADLNAEIRDFRKRCEERWDGIDLDA